MGDTRRSSIDRDFTATGRLVVAVWLIFAVMALAAPTCPSGLVRQPDEGECPDAPGPGCYWVVNTNKDFIACRPDGGDCHYDVRRGDCLRMCRDMPVEARAPRGGPPRTEAQSWCTSFASCSCPEGQETSSRCGPSGILECWCKTTRP